MPCLLCTRNLDFTHTEIGCALVFLVEAWIVCALPMSALASALLLCGSFGSLLSLCNRLKSVVRMPEFCRRGGAQCIATSHHDVLSDCQQMFGLIYILNGYAWEMQVKLI
jgi:hypothetical protein